MIKLVVADFDGTLKPFAEDAVSSAVKQRIELLLERGVSFAVSSGRTYGELAAFLPEYLDRIYLICNDGAFYQKGDKILYEKQIEHGDLVRIFPCVEGEGRIFHAAKQNYCIGEVSAYGKSFSPIPVKSVYGIKEKIFKITTFGTSLPQSVLGGMRIHWDGGPNAAAQLVNRYVNKGTALSDLQTRLMVTKYDTACIGDAGNDIPMMHGAKYSFCVGNRSQELAAVAAERVDHVIDALDRCLSIL